jgi:hypothetical protein
MFPWYTLVAFYFPYPLIGDFGDYNNLIIYMKVHELGNPVCNQYHVMTVLNTANKKPGVESESQADWRIIPA